MLLGCSSFSIGNVARGLEVGNRGHGWGGKTPDVTSHAQIHYWTRVRLKRGSKGEWGRVREGAKGGVGQAQDGP